MNTWNLFELEATHDRETIASMGSLKDMAYQVRQRSLPRFPSLRYIPLRYQHLLPLKIARRYQCLAIGEAQGVLTVAMARAHDASVYRLLESLTGYTIFPVLVEPMTLSLLLRRIERHQRLQGYWPRPSSFIHQYQA